MQGSNIAQSGNNNFINLKNIINKKTPLNTLAQNQTQQTNQTLQTPGQAQFLPQTQSPQMQNMLQGQSPYSNNYQSSTKSNKKSFFFKAIAIIGIAFLITNLIKGKKQPRQSLKTFLDKNGNEIKKVNFNKGKAILPDGSKFTGTMQTINSQGDKIELTYKNGNLTRSNKNDCLFKTYKTPLLSTQNKLTITQYNDTGDKTNTFNLIHNDKGTLKRFEQENAYALDFDNFGRIKSKDVFQNNGNKNNFKKRYSSISYRKNDKSINANDVEKHASKVKFFDKYNTCTKECLVQDNAFYIKNNSKDDFITINFSKDDYGFKIESISIDETARKKTFTIFEDSKAELLIGNDEYNLKTAKKQNPKYNATTARKIKEEIKSIFQDSSNETFKNINKREFTRAVNDFLNDCRD